MYEWSQSPKETHDHLKAAARPSPVSPKAEPARFLILNVNK